MSYTVIARRWRPQKLDEVIGQRAVTQTLRNAMSSGRVAQAFVFAGPRGVGKTTTARILARMLNCANGPTADPCGTCDPCREIAEGRDMDVLEIDAATHTGIDNVREVIISGLAIVPVRDKYKIFIIDEVHQLSASSFNALLKSIEEPPPHVTFIMATTALDKIPETIASRSQVFEFKTISSRAIGDQLKKIAVADGITASDEAIALVARAAEGSMRDAETAFDQVLAFAGNTVGVEDVATVLGLVGRDLLFDVLTAVADENGAAAFELAGRAVEAGYDLRLLCRELARLVRDLLVLSIDETRFTDTDIAPEQDHERLKLLLPRFSREDLLRAFDVLARAESEIKGAAEPRYHLEMALLRWIHLRKLTPLSDLIEQLQGRSPAAAPPPRVAAAPPTHRQSAPAPPPFSAPSAAAPSVAASSSSATVARRVVRETSRPPIAPPRSTPPPPAVAPERSAAPPSQPAGAGGSVKDTYLEEIRKARGAFYGSVVAQAQRIEFESDRIVFRFTDAQKFQADQVWQNKDWLEKLALQVAGRRLAVAAESVRAETSARAATSPGASADQVKQEASLKAEALASPTVQALLGIFAADITDVTELKKKS
ncbi:MAG: DNA polymerase III subunit gamma/tau [Acidobacteria bacterium]|nr:DNA polymerase III subunit gamma/tau [Acidobacteriota bacterium]